MDPEATRNGRWMIALGVLLCVVGAVLIPLSPAKGWGYYFGSPQQNGLLLIGLGGLCLMVGVMNVKGGLEPAPDEKDSPAAT